MANPNLLALTTVRGENAKLSLANTSATVLVNNPAGSNKLIMVASVIAANDDTSVAVEVTLTHNTADDGAGTAYNLARQVSVPAKQSVVLVSKAAPVLLKEDESLVITAGAANDLDVAASWFELS